VYLSGTWEQRSLNFPCLMSNNLLQLREYKSFEPKHSSSELFVPNSRGIIGQKCRHQTSPSPRGPFKSAIISGLDLRSLPIELFVLQSRFVTRKFWPVSNLWAVVPSLCQVDCLICSRRLCSIIKSAIDRPKLTKFRKSSVEANKHEVFKKPAAILDGRLRVPGVYYSSDQWPIGELLQIILHFMSL
jgi:hypothetical protein